MARSAEQRKPRPEEMEARQEGETLVPEEESETVSYEEAETVEDAPTVKLSEAETVISDEETVEDPDLTAETDEVPLAASQFPVGEAAKQRAEDAKGSMVQVDVDHEAKTEPLYSMDELDFEEQMSKAAHAGFAPMIEDEARGQKVAVTFAMYKGWKEALSRKKAEVANPSFLKRLFGGTSRAQADIAKLEGYIERVDAALANAEVAEDDGRSTSGIDRRARQQERQKRSEQVGRGGKGKMAA